MQKIMQIHAGEAMTRCLHFRLIAFNFEQVHQTDRNIRTDRAVLTVSQTVVISKYKSEASLSVCCYDMTNRFSYRRQSVSSASPAKNQVELPAAAFLLSHTQRQQQHTVGVNHNNGTLLRSIERCDWSMWESRPHIGW